MEAQKTITIAYNVSPQWIGDILSSSYRDSSADFIEFLSWKRNPKGRYILALEQYLKHTKIFDKICFFPYDVTYKLFTNGTFAG